MRFRDTEYRTVQSVLFQFHYKNLYSEYHSLILFRRGRRAMLGVTCPAVPPPVKIIRFIITSRLEYVLFLHTSNIIKIISILYFLKEIGQVAKLWRNLQTSQKFEGSKMNDKKDEFKECNCQRI